MTSKDDSRVSRVQTSFQKLATAATSLNTISDQLGKVVVDLDESLKTLNLGITSWFPFSVWEDVPDYSSDEVGYAKIGGKWGIAIRSVEGDYNSPEEEHVEAWLFKDAPRALRIDAIDKIPELLEKLLEDADKTVNRINEKLRKSQELATAVKTVAKGADKLRPVELPLIGKSQELSTAAMIVAEEQFSDEIKAAAKGADKLRSLAPPQPKR